MEKRQCTQCNTIKVLDLFPLKKDNKTGKEFYRRICIECHKAKERQRVLNKYHTDPEYKQKTKNNSKERAAKNPWYNRDAVSKRHKANPDKVKMYVKKWTDNNRDKLNQYAKEYAANNREKLNENYARYYQWTIEWNFLERCKSRWKQAKKKYNLSDDIHYHDIKKESFWILFDKQWWRCAITGISLILIDPFTNEPYLLYEIDHINPISKWWIHSITNLQLTYPPANSYKWDTINVNSI